MYERLQIRTNVLEYRAFENAKSIERTMLLWEKTEDVDLPGIAFGAVELGIIYLSQ